MFSLNFSKEDKQRGYACMKRSLQSDLLVSASTMQLWCLWISSPSPSGTLI